jgi:hypothetical protein
MLLVAKGRLQRSRNRTSAIVRADRRSRRIPGEPMSAKPSSGLPAIKIITPNVYGLGRESAVARIASFRLMRQEPPTRTA